jgi:prepilin-type N-terminal cleavage/methylation domain-containing protein
MTNNFDRRGGHRRAFSLIEMLISLAITGTLLTAALTALDTSFRSYKATTESASTHVVSRMVMHRLMAMIRNGTEFGPYPVDTLDAAQNPLTSNFVEFTSIDNAATGQKQIIRIEQRATTDPARGPSELWYIQTDFTNGLQTAQNSRPLVSGLTEATFTLEYDVGPRLRKATVDMTVRPNDLQDAKIGSDDQIQLIRFVSSVNPRRLD